jgi:hypothetical protein
MTARGIRTKVDISTTQTATATAGHGRRCVLSRVGRGLIELRGSRTCQIPSFSPSRSPSRALDDDREHGGHDGHEVQAAAELAPPHGMSGQALGCAYLLASAIAAPTRCARSASPMLSYQ